MRDPRRDTPAAGFRPIPPPGAAEDTIRFAPVTPHARAGSIGRGRGPGAPVAPVAPETDAELTVPIRLGPPAGLRVAVAPGLLLVAWSYLFALPPNRHGDTPGLLVVVREWLNDPLGLGEDFGALGIALLLISGGYTIAAAFELRGVGRTLARALLVAAPGTLLAALLTAGLLQLGASLTGGPAGDTDLLGFGWVLIVGVLALLLAVPIAVLPRSLGWVAPVSQLAVAAAIVATASGSGGWYAELGKLAAFVPLVTFGQVLHGPRSGRLPGWAAGLGGVGALAVLVLAERVHPELAGWWYPLAALYAGLGTMLALTYGDRFARIRPVRWLASRAFPLFLAVGVAGFPVTNLLYADAGLPLAVAFPAGLLVTGLVGEAAYRLSAFTRRWAR